MARKTKDAPGRVTPKGGAEAKSARPAAASSGRVTAPAGRYTAPVTTVHEHSPWWVPTIMIAFFAVGVIGILLDYMGVFGTPSNWYLLGGLGCVVAGFVVATRWH